MGSEIKILKANGGVKEKGMCLKDQYMGGRAMGAGGGAVIVKFVQNLPFLPQILAFLCLQPPHFQIHSAVYAINLSEQLP